MIVVVVIVVLVVLVVVVFFFFYFFKFNVYMQPFWVMTDLTPFYYTF